MSEISRRIGVLAVALALASCLSGTAAAYEAIAGVGPVESVDVDAGTLVLDGLTFEVTPRTVLTGLEGERIGLADLRPPPPAKGGLIDLKAQPNVRYEGAEVRGRRLLNSAIRIDDFER